MLLLDLTGKMTHSIVIIANIFSAPTDGMTHENEHYQPECVEDVDYQLSVSTAQAHWIIPEPMMQFVSHVTWQLDEQVIDGEL